VQCSDGSLLNLMEGGKATVIRPERGYLDYVLSLGEPPHTEADTMLYHLSSTKMLHPEWFGNE
ncbi:MAG TPA: hypothetical protein VFR94_06085, partial [Nitrososphaeraceae archaeon]|nr:hypothetical protein [Nitrososphaeraceae archaeon]